MRWDYRERLESLHWSRKDGDLRVIIGQGELESCQGSKRDKDWRKIIGQRDVKTREYLSVKDKRRKES